MKAVNLIPSEQRGGGTVGARSGGAAFAVLGLIAGLAILTLLYGSADHELSSRRAEAATLTARAQQVQAQAQQLSPYMTFVALREQRLEAISTLIGSRFDWSATMGELSRVLPAGVALTSMQGKIGSPTGSTSGSSSSSSSTTPSSTPSSSTSPASAASGSAAAAASAAAVSSATPPGTTPVFTLAGCATSQATVAQMLVRLRLISGVQNVSLLSSTKSGGGGGGSGSCQGNDPVFSVDVTFAPLPTPSAASIQALESGGAGAGAGAGTAGSSRAATGATQSQSSQSSDTALSSGTAGAPR